MPVISQRTGTDRRSALLPATAPTPSLPVKVTTVSDWWKPVVPWVALTVFAGFISILVLLPGKTTFLGDMYAFGAMLSFTIAHIAVARLRVIDPDRERPYRGPGTLRIAGRECRHSSNSP